MCEILNWPYAKLNIPVNDVSGFNYDLFRPPGRDKSARMVLLTTYIPKKRIHYLEVKRGPQNDKDFIAGGKLEKT